MRAVFGVCYFFPLAYNGTQSTQIVLILMNRHQSIHEWLNLQVARAAKRMMRMIHDAGEGVAHRNWAEMEEQRSTKGELWDGGSGALTAIVT